MNVNATNYGMLAKFTDLFDILIEKKTPKGYYFLG